MHVDKQTVSDIEVFTRQRNVDSIYKRYNKTATLGGSEKLYSYLRNPVSDYTFLEERKNEILFFYNNEISFKLKKREIDFVEHYRKIRRFPLRGNWIDAFADGVQNKIVEDGDYYIIREGIFNLLKLLSNFKEFLDEMEEYDLPQSLQAKLKHSRLFLDQKALRSKLEKIPKESNKLKWVAMGKLDTLFRRKGKNELQQVLDTIYMLDVWQTMAEMLNSGHYSMANYKNHGEPTFEMEDGFHPFLEKPVKNSFSSRNGSGLCFLTGPNMSGKSTFLKTLGLTVYLAHVGFPVPAKRVETSIYNGLFTTINLSDSLNLGLSHFYSEVKRVKEMALELKTQQGMFVIFDELFKGTNVKDAFDSTLMVVRALAEIKNSIFFISSHILEVAEEMAHSDKIDFRCFKSLLVDDKAVYDYKLKPGVSLERVGFQIVKNEKIGEILEQIIEKQG